MISRQWNGHLARLVALGAMLCGMGPGATACAPRPEPQTHTVTMEGLKFQPAALTVKAGDTVVWVNNDMFPHTATSNPGGFDSGAIAAGESWRYTIQQKGEFAYVCTYHPTMKGSLTVESS